MVIVCSEANGVFKLVNFLVAAHYGLLHDGLLPLELHYLFLHVVILSLLLHYARLQLLEVGHHVRVYHFNVLIVLRRQVVLHQTHFLPQHLDLLLVLAQGLLTRTDPVLDAFDVSTDAVFGADRDFGTVLAQGGPRVPGRHALGGGE
uniref:Uncharacterized protein n=1 Tax=Favella ehrenbergii TaxID=182087 RepID=A0A7S3I318_9SPIT